MIDKPVPRPVGGQRTLDEAEALHNDGRFAEAAILLEELRAEGYKSRFVNLDSLIEETRKQRDEALRREEATREFREIAALARMAKTTTTEAEAYAAWKQFRQEYPELVRELDHGQLLAKRFAFEAAKPIYVLPLLDWITIPAGMVALENNGGTHDVAPFAISKYPITNAQFNVFMRDHGYLDDRWWQGLAQRFDAPKIKHRSDDHPRKFVSWYEALAFCRWLSDKLVKEITLPTEMQWQRAAQGDAEFRYPWGATFAQAYCNTSEIGLGKTTSVTSYPSGVSPFGVLDMVGNVWEWCLNPYDAPGSEDVGGEMRRALRGGSWHSSQVFARCGYRNAGSPVSSSGSLGFRIASSGTLS